MRLSNRRKNMSPSVLSILQAAQQISQREEFVDSKIKKLDAELLSYGEQMKKAKPGPALDALKNHAVLVLKQKRRYEIQKVLLDKQRSKIESIASAAKSSNKERKSIADIHQIVAEEKECSFLSVSKWSNPCNKSSSFWQESFGRAE